MSAVDIMLETGWTTEYVMEQDIDLISWMGIRIRQNKVSMMGAGLAPMTGRKTGGSDRWSTKRWEEDMGGGRKRVRSRVNIADAIRDPGLLDAALSGR